MNNKYCLKCGKPAEMCPECEGKRFTVFVENGTSTVCPRCSGIGTDHKCKPEDLEEKSFEDRWLEDEKEAKQ